MRIVRWFDALPVKGLVAVVCAILGAGFSAWAFVSNTNTDRNCQTNPLRLVYDPHRLKVLKRCQTITGTVKQASREHDGDVHMLLAVNPRWLNAANYRSQRGDLVVEFMPTDDFPFPRQGDRLCLLCTLVNDVGHSGWRECHPVWSDQVLKGGTVPLKSLPFDPKRGNE